jgi:Nitrile hydratase, alpha chain
MKEEEGKKMSQIISKCWSDEGFKRKLLADPAATLKAEGVELPAGLSVKALENTDKVFHLVIPAKPTDLSDEDLDKVAGGIPNDKHKDKRQRPWENDTTR